MSSSTIKSAETRNGSISPARILNWIAEARAAVRQHPWSELLNFGGIDAFELMLSPLYLTLLNAARDETHQQGTSRHAAWNRVHSWGYGLKTAFQEHRASRLSTTPGPAEVVLWTRDPTHTDVVVPVARALRQQGVTARTVACQARIFNALVRRDPQAVFTMGAWPTVVRSARRDGARRARRLASTASWTLPPLDGVPARILETAVRGTVIRFLPLVSEAVANAHAMLDAFNPKLLVVGNDLTLEGRAGCRVARSRDVATAVFSHGSIADTAAHAFHCADRILVYGSVHRDALVGQGIGAEHVIVCGAPRLDDRPRQTGRIHPRLEERLGLRSGEPWILVATSGPGHQISQYHHRLVIENLARLSQSLPEVPIVIKLHRKDRLHYYQESLANAGDTKLKVVPVDVPGFPQDIFEWLQGCPLVLTGGSTVAMEAMLIDVPVVTMDFCGDLDHIDFISAGATVHARTLDELTRRVRDVLSNGLDAETNARAGAYLTGMFGALDGHAADRGAESLRELIAYTAAR